MKPDIKRSVVGGIVGTAAFTFILYVVAPGFVGHPIDIARMLSGLLSVSWGVGMAVHAVIGVLVLPFVYERWVYAWLRGRPWMKGILFGAVVWFVAEAVVVPAAGGGFFHAHAGGAMAVLASLIAHFFYGALLGWIAGYGVESEGTRYVTADPERRQEYMTQPH